MKKEKKDFDALKWKRATQEKIYKKTKDMTIKEEMSYFEKSVETNPLFDWINSLRDKSHKKAG